MKNKFILISSFFVLTATAQVNVGGTINSKANEKTGEAIDAIWNSGKKKDKETGSKTDTTHATVSAQTTQQNASGNASMKAYQNYDFVPGNQILFEDHFTDDQDGEFPAHWKLEQGQGVINTIGDERAFYITVYYSTFSPRMKTASYLPAQYTIEYDVWQDAKYDGNPGMYLTFRKNGEQVGRLNTNNAYYECEFGSNRLKGDLNPEIRNENYYNKWHHVAIAVNGKQIKVYCDQYRVLVVPDCEFEATSLAFGGDASEGLNMIFKNVRIASGGNMNMIGKKFTDTKIVTHGINFDYNKATIKPESMGTLNMIVQIMKDNPDLKFEIGGHSDSDGEDAYNLKLSQQRADAVKAELVRLGVNASRLTSKGYGETKPVSDNNSPEGKANNRRVEFTKI